MKKILKYLLFISLIILLCVISNDVYAVDNYTCNLTIVPNKTTIKPGESITYEIIAKNIVAGTGIKTFETYIDFNSELFDCSITSDSNGNWSRTAFLEGYLTMDKSNLEATAEDQTIANVTFTAKTGIAENNYPIKFTQISFTSGDDNKFSVNDIPVEVKVSSTQSPNTENPNTGSENPTNGSQETPQNEQPSGTSTGNSQETPTGNSQENPTGNNIATNEQPNPNTNGNNKQDSPIIGQAGEDQAENNKQNTATEGKSSESQKENSNQIISTDKKQENKNDSKKEKLPYSGSSSTFEYFLAICVFIALSILFYKKYKNLNI